MSLHILAALIALVPFLRVEDPPHPREDWLKLDNQAIALFRATVAPTDLDVDTLIAKFGGPGAHEDVDCGFGVRRVSLHIYGGYSTIWIDVLAEQAEKGKKGRVAELRARQLGSTDRWPLVEGEFKAAWGDAARPIEHGFEFVRRDDTLAKTLRLRTADALGGVEAVVVPEELGTSFTVLTSPFDEVILGHQHSIDGGPPPGRVEIESLAKAGRFDLVRVVLRGINPEGRLYAAWILGGLPEAQRTKADADAIAKLVALTSAVHTTEGCIQVWRTPREALQFLVDAK